MTLDKIEANLLCGAGTIYFHGTDNRVRYEERVRLLVRAVRQLGAIYKKASAHEDASLDCNFTFYPDPDPDVIALLAEEEA